VPLDRIGNLSQGKRVSWPRSALKERVAELDGKNVGLARLRVDHKDTAARVFSTLGGQERLGELPLARPPLRIASGVKRYDDPRLRDPVHHRLSDPAEGIDVVLIEPNPEPALLKRGHQWPDPLLVDVGVTNKGIEHHIGLGTAGKIHIM
jgi:hypothetical protein